LVIHHQEEVQVKRFVRTLTLTAAAAATFGLAAGSACAADYPTRTIKWVVPYTPAGTTDVLARLSAQYLSEKLGHQIIIENKPGGGNNIGAEYVIRSEPDGYTWLLVNPASYINTTLYKSLKFNLPKDIQGVAGIVSTPNVMVINKDLPVKTVQEFIDYCKKNPGKINLASSGAGTSVHLSGILFRGMSGCDMAHIPYKGAGPALTDIMGNQVQVIFDNLPSSAALIRAGQVRALGVTAQQRDPGFPDLPPISDTVKGYDATAYFGIGVPRATPKAIVDKINAAVQDMLKDPAYIKKFAELGGTPLPGSADDYQKLIEAQTAKWAPVVKASGAVVE
jgi:tripartite-type tricarboxylate transporter receptor subunit TctC